MSSFSDLFHLVQSLSPSEKRYVRVFSKRHSQKGESDYLLLLERMEAQTQTDERDLLAELPERLQVKFPHLKHYLFQLILRALQSYSYEKEAQQKINSLVDKAELLWQRGLERPAQSHLRKAEKLSESSGILRAYPRILAVKRKFLKRNPEAATVDWEALAQEETVKWRQLDAEVRLLRLHDQMFVLLRQKRRALQPEVEAEAREIYRQSREIDPLGGFEGENYRCLIEAFFHHLLLDMDRVVRAYEELLRFWDKQPHLRALYGDRYARIFSAWINYAILAGRGKEAEAEIQKLWEQLPRARDHRETLMLLLANNEMFYLFNTRQYQRAGERADALDTALQEISPKDPRKQHFYLNLLHLYIMLGDFQAALGLFRHFDLRHHEWDSYLQPVYFLIQTELGNGDMLEAWLRSWQRRLRDEPSRNPWISFCLGAFRRLSRSLGTVRERESFEKLTDQLKDLFERIPEPRAAREFKCWFKARRDGLSIAEIAQQS